MENVSRKIKRYFDFNAATAVKINHLSSPKRFVNVAKYFFNRKTHPVIVPYYPLTLMVEVSTVCNLKCPGCERVLYQEEPSLGGLPKANVSFENIKKLEKVLPYVYSTYFVGGLGEPFLNPEFWEIHNFFKKFRIKTGFFTNASLLDEEKIKRTFKERVDSVLVSIDASSKEKYEAIKKGSSWEKAVFALKMFSRLKKENGKKDFQLGLNFIFRTDNCEDIFDYLDLAKEMEINFINASAHIVHVEREKDKSMFDLKTDYKEKLFSKAKEKADRLGIRLRLPNISPFKNCLCYHLWHGVCIFYNGDVCACPFFRTHRPFYYHARDGKVFYEKKQYNDTVLGNYLKQDFFTEIWNGKRAQELRRSELEKRSDCNPCSLCYYKFDLH